MAFNRAKDRQRIL
jgi:hypothetical protein